MTLLAFLASHPLLTLLFPPYFLPPIRPLLPQHLPQHLIDDLRVAPNLPILGQLLTRLANDLPRTFRGLLRLSDDFVELLQLSAEGLRDFVYLFAGLGQTVLEGHVWVELLEQLVQGEVAEVAGVGEVSAGGQGDQEQEEQGNIGHYHFDDYMDSQSYTTSPGLLRYTKG